MSIGTERRIFHMELKFYPYTTLVVQQLFPKDFQNLHEGHLHSDKVTVWCAVSANSDIGLYIFGDGNNASNTITSEGNVNMLR